MTAQSYIKQCYNPTFAAFVSRSDIFVFLKIQSQTSSSTAFLEGLSGFLKTKHYQLDEVLLRMTIQETFTLFCGVFKARGKMLVLFCGA